ncbi:MAG: phosphoenolpyruvate carboxylase [Candidatus Aenigmarchaeota archaeon]|nr:phosphoenolpyruvate carboxylase [Candidatus Aenigmarchaeota archaeon]
MSIKIPKCMSTQHPDNVNSPFFAENTELGGEDEIQEAYYAFSHLGCDEQMWDCEGKEVDNYVVKKLLTKYENFFAQKKLGKDLFITLRVPNPTIEKTEAKILLETLESIPRSFDAANTFYNNGTPPIFEVILPMTTSHKCIDRIYRYYSDFVVGKQNKPICDTTISKWIGGFKPEKINVIPLFEDMKQMLNAHATTKEYLKDKDVDYQRVFLARSDPALNYGNISAVLLNKIALQRLHGLSEDIGVKIYPIIGIGSAPFRGNLRPETVEKISEGYPSVHTFTIQSAFKYDNSSQDVRNAVEKIHDRKPGSPVHIDEEKAIAIIEKYHKEYRKQVSVLAPTINSMAKLIPSRRKRKLHIGLFGYSREMGNINLPRAIKFTASLYSLGLPPELLGLNALNDKDIELLGEVYANFKYDLREALVYFNPDTPFLPAKLKPVVEKFAVSVETNQEHKEMTDNVLKALKGKNGEIKDHIIRAANIRKFLG